MFGIEQWKSQSPAPFDSWFDSGMEPWAEVCRIPQSESNPLEELDKRHL